MTKFGDDGHERREVGYTQDWQGPNSMCAYTMTGVEENFYYVAQQDKNYPLYMVVLWAGISNTAGFAFVEGQEFKRLRCIDIHSAIIYGEFRIL